MATDSPIPDSPRRSHQSTFRPDIEGLRAVAVVSVMLYHAGLVLLPGGFAGVDIFFVISGFLITSLMVREVSATGRLRLGAFWARRARRLLPAATLALLCSAALAVWVLPDTDRRAFGGDIVAGAAYVVNWRLGYRSVDYLAQDVGASPVQHFWSLAVEEQFYVVWPLLIVAVLLLFRARWRRALAVAIAALGAASFLFSIFYSVAQPGLSFFVSTTRAWELSAGALVALALPHLARIPALLRSGLAWAGLATLLVGLFVIHGDAVWPGPLTLLPVLGTAAVIIGGSAPAPGGPGLLLGSRPAVWIGGLSYSLYLWHWPLLVGAQAHWGHLRVRQAVLVLLVSAVPAWLSHRYVENPIRRGRLFAGVRRGLAVGGSGMLTAAAAGLAVIVSFSLLPSVALASPEEAPGAAVLEDPAYADVDWSALEHVDRMRPTPLHLRLALPAIYNTDCVVPRDSGRMRACAFGDSGADHTVVLVGDSKAMQWFTPVRNIARDAGWRLVVIGKNGCQFADAIHLVNGHRSPSCEAWTRDALDKIREIAPDVVLTSTHYSTGSPVSDPGAPPTMKAMADGLAAYWRDVLDTGSRLVVLLDNPGPGRPMPRCVHENLDHLSRCAFDAVHLGGAPAQRRALGLLRRATALDMKDVVCPGGHHCPPVIGNVMVYRDGSHVTDQFATSATPQFSARLSAATGGLLGEATPAIS